MLPRCRAPRSVSAPASPSLRLFLSGAFRLERDGQVVHNPRRQVEWLLAYLALHPAPGGHSREHLAALHSSNSTDGQARASLRTSLRALPLRASLGNEAFAQAWAAGRALSRKEILTLVQQDQWKH